MNKLLKDTSIYLLSTIISSGIPFFLLPMLTKYLSQEDYGIMSLYGTFINFGIPLTGLALLVPVTKDFFYLSKEKYDKLISSVITTWTIIFVIASICLTLSLAILNYKHFNQLFGVIIGLHITLALVRNLSFVLIRNKEMPITYGIFQIVSAIIEIILIWFFVAEKGLDWKGKIAGTLCTLIIVDIAHLFFINKEHPIKFKIDKDLLNGALALSLPLIPNLIAVNIINLSDRLFIINYVGEAENGIYSLAAQLASIVLIINTAVGRAFIPWIYKNLSKNKYQSVHKLINTYTLSIIALSLTIIPLSLILFKIGFIDEKFLVSLKFIGILSVAFAFYAASNLSNNILINEHASKESGIVYIFGGVLCILLNALLIPNFEIMGASIATLVTCVSLYVGVRFQIKKVLNNHESYISARNQKKRT